jgi:hypothetical protein
MIRHESRRRMYAGGRPNRTARFLNGLSAKMFSLGFSPHWAVTLETVSPKSDKHLVLPLVIASYDHREFLVSMLGQGSRWVRDVSLRPTWHRRPAPGHTSPSTSTNRSRISSTSPPATRCSKSATSADDRHRPSEFRRPHAARVLSRCGADAGGRGLMRPPPGTFGTSLTADLHEG